MFTIEFIIISHDLLFQSWVSIIVWYLGSGNSSLIDRTGRTLKMEPLATVKQLERFLVKMVAKQWYDYDRPTFNFVKQVPTFYCGANILQMFY